MVIGMGNNPVSSSGAVSIQPSQSARIEVIGVGGAGCSSSERLAALLPNFVDVLNLDKHIKTEKHIENAELLYLPLAGVDRSETDQLQSQYYYISIYLNHPQYLTHFVKD